MTQPIDTTQIDAELPTNVYEAIGYAARCKDTLGARAMAIEYACHLAADAARSASAQEIERLTEELAKLKEYSEFRLDKQRRLAETLIEEEKARTVAAERALATLRDETLEEAAKVCEAESVEAADRHPEDVAYNRGIEHGAAAIRALRGRQPL